MTIELQKVVDRLQDHIDLVPLEFLKYPEGELRRKPAPDKWSKKEILGHLIDSATNNHHRFVKIQFQKSPFNVEGYAQDEWVVIQKYNEKDSQELVDLWKVYNEHILFIMQNAPEKNLDLKIEADYLSDMGDTFFILMKDYVDHIDHHLTQILNK